jgi:hypothetical protein
MLQAGLYRFRPKPNTNLVLARHTADDQGVESAVHRLDETLLEITVFRLEPCPNPKYPTCFYIHLASTKYPKSYMKWGDKTVFRFEEKGDDGLFLFRFEYADPQWVNYPDRRAPDGRGWLFIGNPVSGANVDVIETKHEGKVVGWGSNGGNNQQWYAEALPESYQAVVNQSDPH